MAHVEASPRGPYRTDFYLVGMEQNEWKIVGDFPGAKLPEIIPKKPTIRVSNPAGSGNIRRVTSTSELGDALLKCYTDEGEEYGATGATGTISSRGESTRCESGNSVRIVYNGYTATIRENI